LNVFCNGLSLYSSSSGITTVIFRSTELCNDDLDHLRRAFYSTSITSLDISFHNIQGKHGGVNNVLQNLLTGNQNLLELKLCGNHIGLHGGALCLGKGLAVNKWLQKLDLFRCQIGNDNNHNNNSSCLTNLNLASNNIFMELRVVDSFTYCCNNTHFQLLKMLYLECNNLGPLGARAMSPSLTLPHLVLQTLDLSFCKLGNDGVSNLIVPSDQGLAAHDIYRSLTSLRFGGNDIHGHIGGENVLALANSLHKPG
jgi:Leucine Rich repeat